MAEQELRKKIAEEICCVCVHKPTSVGDGLFSDSPKTLRGLGCTFGYEQGSNKYCQLVVKVSNQILALIKEKYVRLADVQMLPEVIGSSGEQRRAKRSYADDMLKAGFRKVEL